MAWWVYIVRCRDGTLYTGATNDVEQRVDAHNRGRGARYTRSRRPVRVVWTKRARGRAGALSLEARLKQLTRAQKLSLIGEERRELSPGSRGSMPRSLKKR